MSIIELAFYLFAGVSVASGLMVISARNPVHSVLWLILAFFSSAALFVLLGAEFLAMLLVIVYVGAVAVLFLFVVMMLDVDFVALRQGVLQHLPIGGLIGLILLAELVTLVSAWQISDGALAATAKPMGELENSHALGQLIYTDYFLAFQLAGLVLLVAMIGSIVLTLRQRQGVRRQNVPSQVARRPEDAYALVDVEAGEGVDPVAAAKRHGESRRGERG